MTTILHSPLSAVHVVAAGSAQAAGTRGLLGRKGTWAHRRAGRLYVGSMAVTLGTSFRLYYLFGRFGVVHWGAAGCGPALLPGTGAVVARRRVPGWRRWHYLGMGGSLAGLYATFVVESTYRLFPPACFWAATLGPAGAVLLTGSWLLWRHWPGRMVPGQVV